MAQYTHRGKPREREIQICIYTKTYQWLFGENPLMGRLQHTNTMWQKVKSYCCLARRNPTLSTPSLGKKRLRLATRTSAEPLYHEPPRITRL